MLKWLCSLAIPLLMVSIYKVGILKGRLETSENEEALSMLMEEVVKQQEEVSILSEKILLLIQEKGH